MLARAVSWGKPSRVASCSCVSGHDYNPSCFVAGGDERGGKKSESRRREQTSAYQSLLLTTTLRALFLPKAGKGRGHGQEVTRRMRGLSSLIVSEETIMEKRLDICHSAFRIPVLHPIIIAARVGLFLTNQKVPISFRTHLFIDAAFTMMTATAVADLQVRFPTATAAECRRFHQAFADESDERLNEYLEWRKEHILSSDGSDDDNDDDDDAGNWERATTTAMAYTVQQKSKDSLKSKNNLCHRSHRTTLHHSSQQQESPRSSISETCGENYLPRVLYSHKVHDRCPISDKHGNHVLQVLPARTDLRAASTDTYTTAFLLYLDYHLDRTSSHKLTLLMDVRPGRGWSNPPALQLVGFIRHIATVLHEYYPDRLYRCVIYPVPRPAVYVWNIMLAPFLHPLIRQLIVLVPGAAGLQSPTPRSKLLEYVDASSLDVMEQTRLDAFCDTES